MTADVPTSSMMSVLIKTVLRAKVMVDDLVNFQSRPGSPNTLMAAIKGASGKTSGTDGTRKDEMKHSKKQPQPPDSTRVLVEITGKVGKREAEASRASSGEPSREQPVTSQVTVVDSEESDFAPDIHQVIPLEPCYGLPLVAKDGGGSELKVTVKWFRYNTFKASTISNLVVSDRTIPTLCHMTIHWINKGT